MLFVKRCCSSFQRISSILKTRKPGDILGVRGWIQNIRRMKNNIFLDLSDGSTSQKFQIVVPKSSKNQDITIGSSVKVIGMVQISPNGSYELHAEYVDLIANGHIVEGFPFTPKQTHPPEYVREHLHLRSRVDYIAAQMRLRHRVLKTIHDFFDVNDFVQINTPVITTNDCEGAGEVFAVKADNIALLKEMNRQGIPVEDSYFDGKVFLSVSGQLHLEAMSYGLGNTYTLTPAFRAENSKSSLHLAEFYMLEVELTFTDSLNQLTSFIEKFLKDITRLIYNSTEDLVVCQKKAYGSQQTINWIDSNWTVLSYDEAAKIILTKKDKASEFKKGFSKEQELFLVNYCKTPVFVVDWPRELKPFYVQVSHSNSSRANAVDLLMPSIGELCGGSLRECNIDILQQNQQYPKNMSWYLDLRKFGGIPTGGFGMGVERYLQLLTGFKNIRDVIPFPRYPHSCKM